MNKKTIITVLAAFILGALIGGGAGVLYTTRLTADTLLLLKTGELHESAQQAWQAYFDETPAVATWALSNHLGVLHALREIDYPHDAELRCTNSLPTSGWPNWQADAGMRKHKHLTWRWLFQSHRTLRSKHFKTWIQRSVS